MATADTSEVGYLTVDVGPRIDSLYVVVDQNFEAPCYIANGDTLTFSPGEHYITLAMKGTHDLSVPTRIRADTVQTIQATLRRETDRTTYLEKSSYPVLHNDVNLVVITDRDSRIFVDEEPKGLGVARLGVAGGRHLIEVKHPKAGRTKRIVTVQEDPPRLTRTVLYNKPSWRAVQYRSALPGLAQFHKGSDLKGIALLAGFIGASVGGIHQSIAFTNRNQKYEQSREVYERATSEERALRLGNKTERLYESTRAAYWRRNVLIGTAAGIYLYGFLDAWLNDPTGGYRTPFSRRAQVEPLLGARTRGIRLVVQF